MEPRSQNLLRRSRMEMLMDHPRRPRGLVGTCIELLHSRYQYSTPQVEPHYWLHRVPTLHPSTDNPLWSSHFSVANRLWEHRWWASSSDTLIYYFHFSITSSASLIHPHTDATVHNCTYTCTTIALTSLDRSHLFDGHMIYDSHVFTSILSISNMCPPMVQPIMSPRTVWSGTFYSFASDEPYALFLVCHLYLTCLYLPFTPQKSQRISHMSFPQNWDLALMPCTILHLFHTIPHYITLPHNCTVFTLHHTWRQFLTPRSHPQSPIGFILRSLLHPRHIILEPTARGHSKIGPQCLEKEKSWTPPPFTLYSTTDPQQFSSFITTSQNFADPINSFTIANRIELPNNLSEFYPSDHPNVSVFSTTNACLWRTRSSTIWPHQAMWASPLFQWSQLTVHAMGGCWWSRDERACSVVCQLQHHRAMGNIAWVCQCDCTIPKVHWRCVPAVPRLQCRVTLANSRHGQFSSKNFEHRDFITHQLGKISQRFHCHHHVPYHEKPPRCPWTKLHLHPCLPTRALELS